MVEATLLCSVQLSGLYRNSVSHNKNKQLDQNNQGFAQIQLFFEGATKKNRKNVLSKLFRAGDRN